MIQRIQTVYLLVSLILGIAALFTGMCNEAECLLSKVFAGSVEVARYAYLAFVGLGSVIAGWSIFMFGNRKRQMRFVGLSNCLFFLAIVAFLTCYFINGCIPEWYCLSFYFVVIAVIFNLLAKRRIRYDENLVRSADRIR